MRWSEHSRRIDPISRSAKPFCEGEAGAVGLSRMPMERNRRVTTLPSKSARTGTRRQLGPTRGDGQKSLRADALEHAETRGVHERHYACQPEAGVLEEGPIFRIRSFHSPDVDQHL